MPFSNIVPPYLYERIVAIVFMSTTFSLCYWLSTFKKSHVLQLLVMVPIAFATLLIAQNLDDELLKTFGIEFALSTMISTLIFLFIRLSISPEGDSVFNEHPSVIAVVGFIIFITGTCLFWVRELSPSSFDGSITELLKDSTIGLQSIGLLTFVCSLIYSICLSIIMSKNYLLIMLKILLGILLILFLVFCIFLGTFVDGNYGHNFGVNTSVSTLVLLLFVLIENFTQKTRGLKTSVLIFITIIVIKLFFDVPREYRTYVEQFAPNMVATMALGTIEGKKAKK